MSDLQKAEKVWKALVLDFKNNPSEDHKNKIKPLVHIYGCKVESIKHLRVEVKTMLRDELFEKITLRNTNKNEQG